MATDVAHATIGHPLLQVVSDPLNKKGNIALLTRDVLSGVGLVLEQPLLVTPKPSPVYLSRLAELTEEIRQKCSSQEEKIMIPAIVKRWLPSLRSYAEAPADVRAKILQMQTAFAEPNSIVAWMVLQTARLIHELGLFRGTARSRDDLFAAGVALTEADLATVVTSLIVNSVSPMPDGSEAIFSKGIHIEHSCAPNTDLRIALSHTVPLNRKVSRLPQGTWIAEWRSTHAIKAGEAASFSYLSGDLLAESGDERRMMLHARMGFCCCCPRCKMELGSLNTLSEMD